MASGLEASSPSAVRAFPVRTSTGRYMLMNYYSLVHQPALRTEKHRDLDRLCLQHRLICVSLSSFLCAGYITVVDSKTLHGSTLIGNPASAVILDRYQSSGLLAFLGAVLFTGMISVVALRWLFPGRRWIFLRRI